VEQVRVSNNELTTIRDAMRGLHQMVDRLERGELEKIVLTQRNRMRAVVLPLERYGDMQRRLDEMQVDRGGAGG
jgi:antitoxin (DNA-binding transcriptional repressor) of toxin-antitoxin stability system